MYRQRGCLTAKLNLVQSSGERGFEGTKWVESEWKKKYFYSVDRSLLHEIGSPYVWVRCLAGVWILEVIIVSPTSCKVIPK